MLRQLHYRSRYRGFKKKASTSAVVITDVAKGAIDKPVIIAKAEPAAASSRPAATQPRPAPDKDSVVRKSSKLISLDNIHEHQKKQAEDCNEPGMGGAPLIREFNEANVIDLWREFSASIRETKGGVSVLMEAIMPIITDATITIRFDSDVQKDRFNEVAIQFKNFLKRHIGYHPHVIIEVSQSTESVSRYYTPKDKLERLMELNPALRRFQKELGLDLDYD